MSHDFAKKGSPKKRPVKNNRSPKQPEKKPLPGWLWFLSGVILTLFGQFLIHLAQVDTKTAATDTATAKTSPAKALEPAAKPEPKKPEYRFYDELKTREVNVSAKEVETREQEDYNYALQVGSFKDKKDAEQLRAEVILLGMDAAVESRRSEQGTMWHRVIVGPFTSRSKLQKARSILIDNDLPTMVIKRN
jgi:cell division protein FtsN